MGKAVIASKADYAYIILIVIEYVQLIT